MHLECTSLNVAVGYLVPPPERRPDSGWARATRGGMTDVEVAPRPEGPVAPGRANRPPAATGHVRQRGGGEPWNPDGTARRSLCVPLPQLQHPRRRPRPDPATSYILRRRQGYEDSGTIEDLCFLPPSSSARAATHAQTQPRVTSATADRATGAQVPSRTSASSSPSSGARAATHAQTPPRTTPSAADRGTATQAPSRAAPPPRITPGTTALPSEQHYTTHQHHNTMQPPPAHPSGARAQKATTATKRLLQQGRCPAGRERKQPPRLATSPRGHPMPRHPQRPPPPSGARARGPHTTTHRPKRRRVYLLCTRRTTPNPAAPRGVTPQPLPTAPSRQAGWTVARSTTATAHPQGPMLAQTLAGPHARAAKRAAGHAGDHGGTVGDERRGGRGGHHGGSRGHSGITYGPPADGRRRRRTPPHPQSDQQQPPTHPMEAEERGDQDATAGLAPHSEAGPDTAHRVSECQPRTLDTQRVADTLTSVIRGYVGEPGISAGRDQSEASPSATSATDVPRTQQSTH